MIAYNYGIPTDHQVCLPNCVQRCSGGTDASTKLFDGRQRIFMSFPRAGDVHLCYAVLHFLSGESPRCDIIIPDSDGCSACNFQALLPPINPRRLRAKPDSPQLTSSSGGPPVVATGGGKVGEDRFANSMQSAAKSAGGEPEASGRDGLAESPASSEEVAGGSSCRKGADGDAGQTVDYSVLRNGDTLGSHHIELGWKKNRLVVHGDILRLKTALPTREYYPGGEVWSMGAAPGIDARSDRMCVLLSTVTLFLVLFFALISYLTSSPP
jgi:hypothetical protein